MSSVSVDVLIVGGGLGGVAAALATLERGHTVYMSEEYGWLGGQLTSQGVPLDEHTWIEDFGCTARYRQLRDGIRDYYRRHYPLTTAALLDPHLNPGSGLVSRICAEPLVGVAVIDQMLAPHRASGRLTVAMSTVATAAERDGDRVRSVRLSHSDGSNTDVEARYVLDATELGDLLPLAGLPYVIGAEARDDTGEPSAPDFAQPGNQQAFSWCFAIDLVDGDHTIDRPRDYDHWAARQPDFWGAPMISLTGPDPRTTEICTRTFVPHGDSAQAVADQRLAPGDRELWTFRRIIARENFTSGAYPSDVVMANWPMIDYIDGVLVDVTPQERASHEAAARQQSLSMLYWLQTEAPRPDGGTGFPGLRLRDDLLGGPDGLAMAPYIRESRRIRGTATLTENDLSIAAAGTDAPFTTKASVGVGMYRIDLHPTSGGQNYLDIASRPFEIPLGLLLPQGTDNVLAAGKSVGSTHITNGALRLHPVEWGIGEAAGSLAAFCLDRGVTPHQVQNSPRQVEEFQKSLTKEGVELHWPAGVTGY